ncbi:alpha/beta fold hydrolase [Bdellovibrio svalbardensis]|uniref:Alpha/beta hydrolase n=1 Tax=Bdellovibrio svalbardensis TaxID=2972972 RepID=A0ABT6DEM7_9BACT|nr:alpha/beta hydrolase [Bdellovibrio svalbardensis]MDG0815295.1 alpha/beta hydrolase [Bdellovibrio svalbardensis]
MAYLDNFNHQFYGPETGSPEPRKWIFIHGLMGFGQNWRRIISGLEKTERCLAFDQRGHGRSFKPESGYSPEDYADDLKKIVDELGWKKFNLVGHSMGGRNVLVFASKYPEYVDKLVIEDIGPESSANAHEYYAYLLNLAPTPFASRDEARKFFAEDFIQKAKTRENVEVLSKFFYSNMEEKPDGTVDWRFSKYAIIESVKAGRNMDRWQEVRDLKVPTLLIRGESSQELSQQNYEAMLASNPMIKGVVIPGAGHWVHSDQAQAFVEALKSFVGDFPSPEK